MQQLTSVRDIIESGFKNTCVDDARMVEMWLKEVTHVYLDAENYKLVDVDGITEICKMEKVS